MIVENCTFVLHPGYSVRLEPSAEYPLVVRNNHVAYDPKAPKGNVTLRANPPK